MEVAVNPVTGTIVAMEPMTGFTGWVVTITNHREDGTVLHNKRFYRTFAEACSTFWGTAEWAPE